MDLLLLRPNELGCRTRWGTSLWQDPADDRDPESIDIPQQPTLPEPIAAQLHYDDEVTSVSIAGSKTARPSFEDDVVDSGAVAPGMGSWSDSLQEERRRLLMNGSQEALAGARKRHMEKQTRQRPLIPFADEAGDAAPQDAKEDAAAAPQQSMAAPETSFPPEDFVEEERASDETSTTNDELVDDGLRPGGSRSPRVRKLMRETKSPKDHKAMGLGAPSEMAVTSHNPEQREQWNSVPSMTPGFELPFMAPAQNRPSPGSSLRISASAAPMAISPTPARPVSQARELLSEDRLRIERARRQQDVPMAEAHPPVPTVRATTSPVTNRPRLNQAPPEQAAPVERLKSSPLRGYHPAVKAAAARKQEETRSTSPSPQQDAVVQNRPVRGDQRDVTRQAAPAPVERSRPNPYQSDRAPQSRPLRPEMAKQERRPEPQRARETTPFTGSTIEISPQVPRCCGTCASFRPSGVPGRGSCANEYAGPVQRVVNEQDLACQHTFGCFWLPADEEVWLEEMNENLAATPRVDRMIARRKERKTVVLPDLEELTS